MTEIAPDTKNWTWVLEQACPECGFDTRTVGRGDVARVVRESADLWRPVLAREDVRERPRPDVWSPLEYGAHVRDTFRVFAGRLDLMLREDDPLFENWDQDRTAAEGRYGEQDPVTVSAELQESGEELAAAFDAVPGDAWERRGRRDDGSHFTVETLGRYLVHDPVHHLHDVRG